MITVKQIKNELLDWYNGLDQEFKDKYESILLSNMPDEANSVRKLIVSEQGFTVLYKAALDRRYPLRLAMMSAPIDNEMPLTDEVFLHCLGFDVTNKETISEITSLVSELSIEASIDNSLRYGKAEVDTSEYDDVKSKLDEISDMMPKGLVSILGMTIDDMKPQVEASSMTEEEVLFMIASFSKNTLEHFKNSLAKNSYSKEIRTIEDLISMCDTVKFKVIDNLPRTGSFISELFPFKKTKQGHVYWDMVRKGVRDDSVLDLFNINGDY